MKSAPCFVFLQLAFTSLVYPSLILGYMGQAAYLSQHHNLDSSYQIGFYIAVPGWHTYYTSSQLDFGASDIT